MNENKETLFKRLIARFHSTKIAQKLTSLVVASSLVVSLGACTNEIQDNIQNNNNNDITNNEVENEQNNNENNSNNNVNEDIDVSGYSEILQHVLTDPYYTFLLSQTGDDDPTISYGTNHFAPLPYSFLEDEGFDIESIKTGKLSYTSSAYVLTESPNDLYMMIGVETNGETPYYSQYILKYTLTNQEMRDYNMIYKGNFIQAPLMNQAISDLKTPTVVNESKITVEAYENLLKNLNKHSLTKTLLNGNSCSNLSLISIDEENGKFVLQLISSVPTGNMLNKSKTIAYATLSNGTKLVATNSDGAFYKPSKYNEFMFYEKDNLTSGQEVTIYDHDATRYISTFIPEQE